LDNINALLSLNVVASMQALDASLDEMQRKTGEMKMQKIRQRKMQKRCMPLTEKGIIAGT